MSLDFDGSNDYVTVANIGTLSSLTVEFWMYNTDSANGSRFAQMVGRGANGNGWDWSVYLVSLPTVNTLRWVGPGGTTIDTNVIPLNTWTHIAVTCNNVQTKIYINGALITTQSTTNTMTNQTNAVMFGTDTSLTRPYKGRLSEIRIWNIIRSASDISTYCSTNLVGTETGLIGYYKLNSTSGSTAVDTSASARNGTLSNFTLSGATSNWVSNGPPGINPTFGPFTLGPKSGAYMLADVSFSLTAPTSDSSGAFRYTSDNLAVAVISSANTTSNLLARYDASVASGYTLSGSNVTQWNDLTGNGYHLAANGTGPTLTTIKSLPAFNFNSGYGLSRASVPLTSLVTVFIVARYSTNIAGFGSFMHHGDKNLDWAIERDSASSNVHFQSGNSGNAILSAANDTNYIWIGRVVGNTREFWRYSDTVSTGFISGTPVTITPGNKTLYVGKSDNNEACNSSIGEILYYNASLSNADVSANLLYLQDKWFTGVSATGSGVTLVGNGTANITATQDACGNYMNKSVSSLLTVGISPTFGTFTLGPKSGAYMLADVSFSLTAPTSDSSGAFRYASDNSAVAVIFTPHVATNLLARYDASVVSGYTLSGSNVTQWNDLTGNGYHLIPNGTGPTLTTIKTLSALNFNSGRGLSRTLVPLSTAITVFMVAKYSTAIATWGNFMHHGHRDTDWSLERNNGSGSSGLTVQFQIANDNTYCQIAAANNTNYLWVGRITGNTRDFWMYSDTLAPVYVTSSTPAVTISGGNKTLYVGKSDNIYTNEGCNSSIGEILYYNASLSNADVSANLLYLQNKWFNGVPTPTRTYVNLVANGTANITATQDACGNYMNKSVSSLLTVGQLPTFGTFTLGPKSGAYALADASFSFTAPISDSSGAFSYTSDNSAVAVIHSTPTFTSFTTVGTTSWTVPAGVTSVSALIVGGGGGGGTDNGGGGGGGGVIVNTNIAVTPGTSMSIVVGSGGAAAASTSTVGSNGGNSSFAGLVAVGGGGGGSLLSTIGANGGSAGGRGGAAAAGAVSGTVTTTPLQGNNGGGSTGGYGGGGGGGAGAGQVGVAGGSNVGGKGGDGIANSITNSIIYYAGGGGAGGNGGGGTGVSLGTQTPTPGTNGRGGGGGGGGGSNAAGLGAIGGSGIVIISYGTTISQVILVANGTANITATQDACGNYISKSVSSLLTVSNVVTPTLGTFTVPSPKAYGDASFNISLRPTSDSSGAITYSSSNPSVATIDASGNWINIVGVGDVSFNALQAAVAGQYTSATKTSNTLTVSIGTPTLSSSTFAIATPKAYGDASFAILTHPTSNSSGAITYSSSNTSVATIDASGNWINIVGVGDVSFNALQAAVAGQYTSATKTSNTLTVSKATPAYQPISQVSKTFGVDVSFSLSAIMVGAASISNGAYTFSSPGAYISISGDVATILEYTPSAITITASQAVTTNYNAGNTTFSLLVARGTPSYQVIPQVTKTVGVDASFSLSAIMAGLSSSNGSYTFSSATGAISISGDVATINAYTPSAVIVTASQNTGLNYNSGSTTFSLLISRRTPSLSSATFTIPSPKVYGDASFSVFTRPVSDNSGAITYTSSNTSVATIDASGNFITIVGLGDVSFNATQAETSLFNAATRTSNTLTVSKITISLAFVNPPTTKNVTDAAFTVTATGARPDAVTYSSSNTALATVNSSSGLVTLRGVGTVIITASQASTEFYNVSTATCSIVIASAGTTLQGQTVSSSASFASVDLSGASLVGTTVSGVSFSSANLSNVDFSGAVITGTNFSNANISGATNLPAFSAVQKLQLLKNINNSGVGAVQFNAPISGADISSLLATPNTEVAAATFTVKVPTGLDASANKIVTVSSQDIAGNKSIYIPINENETVKLNNIVYSFNGTNLLDASGNVVTILVTQNTPFKIYAGSIVALNIQNTLNRITILGDGLYNILQEILQPKAV